MGVIKLGRTYGLFLALGSMILSIFVPITSYAEFKSECRQAIVNASDSGSVENLDSASRFLEAVEQVCPTPAYCDAEALRAAADRAVIELSPPKRKLFGKIRLLSQRALVLLLWGGAILGPGVVSYYVSAGMPEFVRYSVSNFVMVMSGVLFGSFSGPIQKKLGPKVEQFAFHLWSPDENDGWGQIMKNIPETDRLKYSQIYNQIIVLRSYFHFAGDAVRAGNTVEAAKHYLHALLNSCDMFAGLHLDNPATVREVRAFLPDVETLEIDVKEAIVREAVKTLHNLPNEELNPNAVRNRGQLESFIQNTLRLWLKV